MGCGRPRNHPLHESGPGWMTRRRGLVLLLALALTAALWPEGRLACADPDAREISPDHAWTLTLCRRPMWFAMPGNSGGAPGWIVLRDAQGAIRGVVDLSMVQDYRAAAGSPTEWEPGRVRVQLVAELPLVLASGPVARWVEARVWRWRALLGLVPTDDMFR